MPRTASASRIRTIPNSGKIDLATLLSDLPRELKAEVDDEYIRLTKTWYLKRTERRCKATIRRYVNAEKLALALGLYRADGQKKPGRIRFVNKDPTLHRWFAEALREMGVTEFKAYAQYCFCEKCGSRKLEDAIKRFEKATKVRVSNVYRNEVAHNPTFYLDVNNKALAMLLITIEKALRKEIAYGNISRNIANKYLRGVLEGDGSLNLKINNGKAAGTHLELYESDANAIQDLIAATERLFGIRLLPYQCEELQASIDLDDLLELMLEGVIPRRCIKKVTERVLIAFRHRRTPWILMRLADTFKNEWFSSAKASDIICKARHHSLETLKALEKKGYLISKKVKDFSKAKSGGTPVRRLFKLTRKAWKLTKLFQSLPLPHHSFPFFFIPFIHGNFPRLMNRCIALFKGGRSRFSQF